MLSDVLTPPRVRFGLRQQLTLALGLLTVLLAIVIAIEIMSRSQIDTIAQQAIVVDGELSRLAGEVAVQTLLCRRYEKDVFLNLDDESVRDDYLARWNTAYTNMNQAIDAFGAVAVTPEDRQQVDVWRAASANYRTGFLQTARAIVAGDITTPQAANTAITPFKDTIRALTDTAVATAAGKSEVAKQTARDLEQVVRTSAFVIATVGILALIIALVWSLLFPARLMRPISALHAAAGRLASGDLAARTAIERRDELGALARTFNQMAATIEQRTSALEEQYNEARAARADAEIAHKQIAKQLATIEEQRAGLRQMSVPILPLTETALVMPLVGELDSERLRLAQEQALRTIEKDTVRYLILDITGVLIVDPAVARGLVQIVQAARLLGTEVVLAGIRPEVAQALVGLDISLDGITSRSTLQSGIAYALQRQ